jgi:Xaa-Pro aminopeptidase
MDKYQLDGLVAAYDENVYYLSDYYGPSMLMARNYTMYALLPRDHDRPAALIIPGSGVYHFEHLPTWMPNIATYITRIRPDAIPPRDYESTTEEIDDTPLDRPVNPNSVILGTTPIMPYGTRPGVELNPRDVRLKAIYEQHSGGAQLTALRALAGAIETAGLASGTLGFDDPQVHGWLNAVGLESVKGREALNVFKEIRMVKSPDEIEIMRTVGQMCERALDKVIAQVQVGMPLDHVSQLHRLAMAEEGGRSEWVIAVIRGLATGVVERNELIKIDSVGSHRMYRGDVGRTALCGEPTGEMVMRNRAVTHALQVAYENIRPGKTFREIVNLTLKETKDAGFPGFVIAGPHSIGIEHTDHPVSVGFQYPGHHELRFEENMVFTLDMPYHEFGWGTTHVEDMMIVRAEGCEPITSMDTSIRVLPG